MPYYRVNGMLVHMKLAGPPKSKHTQPCCARIPAKDAPGTVRCMAFSTLLCDWPLEGGSTCSAPLCAEHGTEVGPDKHYCPIHAKQSNKGDR